MYKLNMPSIWDNDNRLPTVQRLFKEVLGYTHEEIEYFTKTHFSCIVVINLTIDQALEITRIFSDNDIQIFLKDQQTDEILFWQKDLGIIIPKAPPKSHYCDTPLVSRDHLVDAFTEQEKERQQNIEQSRREQKNMQNQNVPKCPTCGSTNVEKISTAKKAFGFAMVGLFSGNFGKTMHCKNCGYKW